MYLWASSEDDELVERSFCSLLVDIFRVSEELKERDNEEAERLVFFDKLVTQIDDDEPPRPRITSFSLTESSMYSAAESRRILANAFKSSASFDSSMPSRRPSRVISPAQGLYHSVQLADVRRLIANGTHEKTPVARLQLRCAELQRKHLDARVLSPARFELICGRKEEHIFEGRAAPKVSLSILTCAASVLAAIIDVNSGR